MMRYFAVDYGTKRVGLAAGDENGFGAYPVATLQRSRSLAHDLSEIIRLANKEEVQAIVVGLPVNADGTEGPAARNATVFARSLLKYTELPIYLHDEFLTTWEAEEELIAADVSRKKRKAVIDRMAAVHLLESFLRAKQEGVKVTPLPRKKQTIRKSTQTATAHESTGDTPIENCP